ncbi:hypothetical protein Q5O24_07660 [Eubacteriaceae bacterium ES3]|nr:hypothetical protein Q5O24_07660 [Eubacteriaceae bacterium ES3]
MNLSVGIGETTLYYKVTQIGSDYLVILTGGESHIGCTAIGDSGRVVSYTPLHHRDDTLAIPLAKAISERHQCICTVVAGFHLDNITRDQIKEIVKNSEIGVENLLDLIEKESFFDEAQ